MSVDYILRCTGQTGVISQCASCVSVRRVSYSAMKGVRLK